MADFTITIPDGKVDMLLDAIASQKGWVEFPEPPEVTMTKLQFAKYWLYSVLKAIVRQEMQQTARETNQVALDAKMDEWANP